jgi:parvulin-like peptidyl-prolyl isomerase
MAKRQKAAPTGLTRKQISRRRREDRLKQVVLYSVIGVGVVVVLVIAFGIVNEHYIVPNKAVATVNGEPITLADFQKRTKFEYYQQTGGQPLQATGLDAAFFGEWFLDDIIKDKIIEQKAAEMGIVVTDAEVEEQLQLALGYDAGDPEPTATIVPTSSDPTGTPTITPTFVYTLTPSPTPTLEPGVTPTATPTATPTPDGSPTPTPDQPPTATATAIPLPTQEPVTEDLYNERLTEVLAFYAEALDMTEEDIRALVFEDFRIGMLSERLVEELDFDVAQTKTIVHAAHILVETHEEALAALERYEAGEEFETLAAELSTDTMNAYKGGDLGWLPADTFVPAFAEAVKNRPIGEVGDPVETQYGWHLIKIYDRQEIPTTPQEQLAEKQELFTELQVEWRAEADVVINDIWQQYLPDLGIEQQVIPGG